MLRGMKLWTFFSTQLYTLLSFHCKNVLYTQFTSVVQKAWQRLVQYCRLMSDCSIENISYRSSIVFSFKHRSIHNNILNFKRLCATRDNFFFFNCVCVYVCFMDQRWGWDSLYALATCGRHSHGRKHRLVSLPGSIAGVLVRMVFFHYVFSLLKENCPILSQHI
jgi:hypothetical protein